MSFECTLCDPAHPKQDNSPTRVHWHLLKKHTKQIGLESSSLFSSKEQYAQLYKNERDGKFKFVFEVLEKHTRRLTIMAENWKDIVLAVFKELEKKKLCNVDILGFGHDAYHAEVYREGYKVAVATKGKWLVSPHVIGCPLSHMHIAAHFSQFKSFCKYLPHTFGKKLEPLFKANFRKHVGPEVAAEIEKNRALQKLLFKQCREYVENNISINEEFVNKIREIVNISRNLIDLECDATIKLFKVCATAKGISLIRDSFLNILHPRELSQLMLAQMLQGCLENPELFEEFRTVIFGLSEGGIHLPEKLKKAREKGIPLHFQSVPYCRCAQIPVQNPPLQPTIYQVADPFQDIPLSFLDMMLADEKTEI